jgi:hypothetical protein
MPPFSLRSNSAPEPANSTFNRQQYKREQADHEAQIRQDRRHWDDARADYRYSENAGEEADVSRHSRSMEWDASKQASTSMRRSDGEIAGAKTSEAASTSPEVFKLPPSAWKKSNTHARNQNSRLWVLDLQDPPNHASRHQQTESLGRAVDAQAVLDGKVSLAEDASRTDEIVQGSTDTRDKEKFWYCHNDRDLPGPWTVRCITCEHDRCRNCPEEWHSTRNHTTFVASKNQDDRGLEKSSSPESDRNTAMAETMRSPNRIRTLERYLRMVQDTTHGKVPEQATAALKEEMRHILEKIPTSPNSYIMTDLEYGIFKHFGGEQTNHSLAHKAQERYRNSRGIHSNLPDNARTKE